MAFKQEITYKTVQVTNTIYSCDICKAENISHHYVCCICHRDLCDRCSKYNKDYGPGPSGWVCKICFDYLKSAREIIKEAEFNYDKVIETIFEGIKEDSLQHGKPPS